MLRLFFFVGLCIIVAGCSKLDFSNLNITNPFSTSSAHVDDVYYGNFPDICIPNEMTIDHNRTLVSVGPDGEKIGLLTFEGRVDIVSLCYAMIHNMSRQGWTLRGVIDGKRTVQLYEKSGRYAILYIYGQKLTTAIEVWVLARLENGAYQLNSSTGMSDKYSSYSIPVDNNETEINGKGLIE